MNHNARVRIAVLSPTEEDVQRVNSMLRDAGHMAHCEWVRDLAEPGEALGNEPELILQVLAESIADVTTVARLRDHHAKGTPLILLGDVVDEEAMDAALRAGAQDIVSCARRDRFLAVIERELRAHRTERALNAALTTAGEYRRQLRAYIDQSVHAIAYVHDGIILHVNSAWLNLFGGSDADALVGMPFMDSFAADSHGPLKGALVAAAQGKWGADALHARALAPGGAEIAVELELEQTDYEGEPAVRVSIAPSAPEETANPAAEMQAPPAAAATDPGTGLLCRARFLELLEERLDDRPDSGVHVLAWIKPDRFGDVRSQVGIFHAEDVLTELAAMIDDELGENEIAGRFEGTTFLVLLRRGSERDAERWARRLLEKVKAHRFLSGQAKVRLTCTIGLCPATGMIRDASSLVAGAADAHAHGRDAGGATVFVNETADTDTLTRRNDATWVRCLKSALMENRFRLLQLPIASLDGEQQGMFDILLRMVDEQGNKILPSEFLPIAERNNLLHVIDRWVIGASCRLAASGDAGRLFVRLSRHSIMDESLPGWLQGQFRSTGADARQFCFQLGEEDAIRYLHQFSMLTRALRTFGAGFALEHVGVSGRSLNTVEKLRPDFVKIDGSLVQSLARDEGLQREVRTLVERCAAVGSRTIAERVEDANTMAVLWQLGISYMQGHYVHEPEVVLQETA